MRRVGILLLALVLAALPAAAAEIHLRDGTVIEATSYSVTGSYVMLVLADGRQVAYDVADVDLEALRGAGAETAAQPKGEQAPPSLSQDRRLAIPAEGAPASGFAITDADVKHVRGSSTAIAEEGEGEAPPSGGPPAGYASNGRVGLDKLDVLSQGGNSWLVQGEVVNHGDQPVINVKVQLQTLPPAGQAPWSGEVEVAAQLMPGQKATFSQSFTAAKEADKAHPEVRASVIWMQRQGAGQQGPATAQKPPFTLGAPESKGLE